MMTVAEQLHGQVVSLDYATHVDKFSTEGGKKIYEFKDGSKAFILTGFENCEPYMTSSLSTLAKRAIRRWVKV